MENYTNIRVELDVQAQRLISQYMIDNEKIKGDIEKGIISAFESIDIVKEVENTVIICIQSAIKQSSEWGKIRQLVKEKTDEIVESIIDKSIEDFKFKMEK